MAPHAARKRKSDEMEDSPNTPKQAFGSKRMKITQTQKQALIDNLQLEVTERARQLRAHYALQCQDLKARIERRINRVPVAMRKLKMVDLISQHQKINKTQATTTVHAKVTKPVESAQSINEIQTRSLPVAPEPKQQKLPSPVRKPVPQSHPPPKSRKRKSSAVHIISDKENDPQADGELDTSNTAIETDSLPVQKNAKRAKTAAAAAAAVPKRTTSKAQKKPTTRSKDTENHVGILSPRSHNSRTLPRSPIKDTHLLASPTRPVQFNQNSPLRQPQSPQRPPSPFKAATSAISAFAKRGAAAAANLRPSSRDKDATAAATANGTLVSPTGRMRPPPRPALATVTSSNAYAVPNLTSSSSLSQSPQRTVSQTSMRSAASEQSTTSTNGTVVTKPARSANAKQDPHKRAVVRKPVASKQQTVTAAAVAVTRTKTVISEIAVAPLSPKTGNTKGGMKRAATTAAARATAAVRRAGTTRKVTATTATETTAQTGTGRVLRKRY